VEWHRLVRVILRAPVSVVLHGIVVYIATFRYFVDCHERVLIKAGCEVLLCPVYLYWMVIKARLSRSNRQLSFTEVHQRVVRSSDNQQPLENEE
jgi:hypothetical protein